MGRSRAWSGGTRSERVGGAGGSLSWVVVILHTESLFLNVVFFFFFAFCLPFLNSGFRVFCTLGASG